MSNTADDQLCPSFGVSWIWTFHMFDHSNISEEIKKKIFQNKIRKNSQIQISSVKLKKIEQKIVFKTKTKRN